MLLMIVLTLADDLLCLVCIPYLVLELVLGDKD
jgi:hypothetical protein